MTSPKQTGWILITVLLTACGSNYQAPVDDRSAALEREAPLILSDGQVVPMTSRPAAAGSASQTSQPNTQTAPVGASTTVVRPVAVGTGIQRQTIGGDAAASATAPVTSAPATSTSVAPTSVASSSVNTAASEDGVHVVARGDTLYSIAWAYSLDVRSLALANNLSEPYTIFPGQRLIVREATLPSAAISAVPDIPAAPAGVTTASTAGSRPQEAAQERRSGNVSTRQVDGVSWQWPADGRLLSTFSPNGSNRGIGIAGMAGESVYAAADGDVVYAGRGIQGAGNLVILRHSARHLSAYMYNSRLVVSEGDRVRAGDKIAEMGSGPNGRDMLNFEVRLDGKPVDPVRYLPGR